MQTALHCGALFVCSQTGRLWYNKASAVTVFTDGKEDLEMELSKKEYRILRKAQKGELDAVWMYKRLAKAVVDEADREAFERLAKDEKRHANVFRRYTARPFAANPAKAIMIPLMYKLIGKEKLYPVIANAEYKAAKKYEKIVDRYPDVRDVLNDEVHHGDAVLGLLK